MVMFMKKKLLFSLMTFCLCSAAAYSVTVINRDGTVYQTNDCTQNQNYNYRSQNEYRSNSSSIANKYYNKEITTDQYIDSLGVPRGQTQETTIYHGNGSKSLIRSNSYGGTIYNDDGSKSVYYNSPN